MAGGPEPVETLEVTPLLRAAALAGALCFLALLVGLRVADVTDVDDIDPGRIGTGASLFALAAVFAVLFTGAVWAHVRRAADVLGVVAAGAGVLLAVQLLGLADRGHELAGLVGADGTRHALEALNETAMRHLAVPVLVLAAVVAFGHRLAPGWFRWASAIVAVLLAVVLAPFDAPPVLALAGGVWLLLASLVFGLGDLFPSDD